MHRSRLILFYIAASRKKDLFAVGNFTTVHYYLFSFTSTIETIATIQTFTSSILHPFCLSLVFALDLPFLQNRYLIISLEVRDKARLTRETRLCLCFLILTSVYTARPVSP